MSQLIAPVHMTFSASWWSITHISCNVQQCLIIIVLAIYVALAYKVQRWTKRTNKFLLLKYSEQVITVRFKRVLRNALNYAGRSEAHCSSFSAQLRKAAERLRAWRLQRRLSQASLADDWHCLKIPDILRNMLWFQIIAFSFFRWI